MRKRVPQERADERVWELLYLRSQNKITPARFVDLVNIVDMRPPQYSPYPLDSGYIPGTFDIIATGFTDGVVTEEEYVAISEGRSLCLTD